MGEKHFVSSWLCMGEMGAIASPTVLLSPSHQEPCTAQGLGAPVGPSHPNFIFLPKDMLLLQCQESSQE